MEDARRLALKRKRGLKMRYTTGFTLIELLVIIVIIGLLAMIALPRFVNTRERAHLSAMRSDLRNLATAEEDYFAQHLVYTTNVSNLTFNASTGIVVTIPMADTRGWLAKASHYIATHLECEIYYGTASGASIATSEGAVYCNN